MISMPSKHILITGGTGFIGSHLCKKLLENGHYVICLDNFSTSSIANVSSLLNHPRFTAVEHDITEPINFEVEEIYNLACPASPKNYQIDPVKTIKTSVLGAIHVLELAKRINARVFHASTSEVYGDPLVHPQTEEYWGNVNPVGIRSCYDEGKRCAETLVFDYSQKYSIDTKVARIFNTYGPYMHPNDGRVVSNFIVQALQNEDITIYGCGTQTRAFCYIDDLVEGILCLMQTGRDFTGPINLGNPAEFTVMELAQKVLYLTESQSKLRFVPLPQDDPRKRCPDISLAISKLGWNPKVKLEEGLKKTIAYFKENLL